MSRLRHARSFDGACTSMKQDLGGYAVKNIMVPLAALLLFPAVALAEPEASLSNIAEPSGLNIEDAKDETIKAPDGHQLDPQLDEAATDHLDLKSTERPANGAGPFVIAPKFDFGAGLPHETDASVNPYEPVPEPAPGFVIRIPTN